MLFVDMNCMLLFLSVDNLLSNVRQILAQCGASVDAASIAACPVQTVPLASRPDIHFASAEDPVCAWRSGVDRTLSLVLKRVASVEDAIVGVAGGIETIVRELKRIGRMVREDPALRPPGSTANPGNSGDMVEFTTTPNCPDKEPVTLRLESTPTDANRRVLVELDDTSNQNADDEGTDGGEHQTPETHLKRVHAQPRLRVVPCAKTVLGVAATAATGETRSGATPNPIVRAPRYKDPPGYDDLKDFGDTEGPCFKPPLLQPKTHGVSRDLTRRIHSKEGS